MPSYIYEVIDKTGKTIKGELIASTREEAVGMLERRHMMPVEVTEKGSVGRSLSSINIGFERFGSLDRIILVRNLSVTLKAGLSLSESIDILIADSTKKKTSDILSTAKAYLQNGQDLSQALAKYPQYFPEMFIGMIKAGELSGQLDKSLEELSQQLSKEYSLAKKVKSALAYPVILLAASGGIVVMLMTFVLPRLAKTFTQSQVKLPWLTSALMATSKFITGHVFLDLAFLAFLGWLGWFVRRTDRGRNMLANVLFTIPAVRNLVKKIILVRLTRTLGSLLSSAMSITESLELVCRVVNNHRYQAVLERALQDIKNGSPISNVFRDHAELFPRFLTSLVTVGEKTGTLDQVLKTFADFYDEEVDDALKDLATFLEPVLLLLMGVIVGVIALAILLPIYQLVGNFV
jgi:type II secretory pathway component PulF